jgi:hypothetical protein
MNLTKSERLILFNQYQILEKLDPENAKDYANAAEIVSSGYTRLYGQELAKMLDTETPPETCEEVTEILDMYRALNTVKHEVFPGFDGNNESEHYSYARFMIEDLGRWNEFKKDDLNSHMGMLYKYRLMLAAWKASPKKHELTPEDCKRILETGSR